jgi:hypothetical protein
MTGSRIRKAVVLTAAAGALAVAGAGGIFFRDFAVRAHLRELAADPAKLWDFLRASEGPRRQAAGKFVGTASGARAYVEGWLDPFGEYFPVDISRRLVVGCRPAGETRREYVFWQHTRDDGTAYGRWELSTAAEDPSPWMLLGRLPQGELLHLDDYANFRFQVLEAAKAREVAGAWDNSAVEFFEGVGSDLGHILVVEREQDR